MLPPLLALALAAPPAVDPFATENLVAWCVVPFDKTERSPADRAAMLARLGFRHFAYDWRAKHLPTFDDEVKQLATHGVALDAVWFPPNLGPDANVLLDVVARHKLHPQLWVSVPDPKATDQAAKVAAVADVVRPIAAAAAKLGCKVGLYNHGGWFGEPENQLAVIDTLKLDTVGLVYNLHHGHAHLDRFPELLKRVQPRLLCLNLSGMVTNGDKVGRKIVPLGAGDRDPDVLAAIRASGYGGPVGVIGHTNDDAEERLRDNLDGLRWLLSGRAGPPPAFRTFPPK